MKSVQQSENENSTVLFLYFIYFFYLLVSIYTKKKNGTLFWKYIQIHLKRIWESCWLNVFSTFPFSQSFSHIHTRLFTEKFRLKRFLLYANSYTHEFCSYFVYRIKVRNAYKNIYVYLKIYEYFMNSHMKIRYSLANQIYKSTLI